MKKTALLVLALAVLVTLNIGWVGRSYAQGKVVRLTLIDENGSGEDGSAQITDLGDGSTKVELIMLNAPEGATQPASIHEGTCANMNAKSAYDLQSVKEGKSTSTVKATLSDLTSEKYSIAVYKSATENIVYSCGNLPSGTTTSGPMTMDQVLDKMLDDANELLGTVKKKEADASQAAYDTYHTTFAAHENDIKAKSAETQLKLEDAMHEVRDAITAADWDKAEQAAEELVAAITAAKTTLAGSSTSTGNSSGSGAEASGDMASTMNSLKAAAADVQREAKNNDKDGAQRAYDEFHTLFAANENAIKAKNAEAQEHIEAAMHEVRDAITAGDFTKAATAADELVKEVRDVEAELAAMTTNADLPTSGNSFSFVVLLALTGAALTLLAGGASLRRRVTR
jgi:hypothetical protein